IIMFKNITRLALEHKFVVGIAIAFLAYGGYWGYKKMTDTSGETKYLLAEIKRGTITASVFGSGQVSASNQVDIKARAAGDVVYVGAKNGDGVGAGAVLVRLDA